MSVQRRSGQEAQAITGSGTGPVAPALPAAPVAGNMLWFVMGGDKNTGAITGGLAGFTQLFELLSSSVSLYVYYKVSDGTEQNLSVTWTNSSAAGNVCWYFELEDPAVSGSTWQISAQASNITDESSVNTKATGTTGNVTDAGLGLAFAAIDSSQSISTRDAWGNSYTGVMDSTGQSGRGAPFVAEKAEAAGSPTSSTFNYTGTADQVSAAIAVATKVDAGGAPQEALPDDDIVVTGWVTAPDFLTDLSSLTVGTMWETQPAGGGIPVSFDMQIRDGGASPSTDQERAEVVAPGAGWEQEEIAVSLNGHTDTGIPEYVRIRRSITAVAAANSLWWMRLRFRLDADWYTDADTGSLFRLWAFAGADGNVNDRRLAIEYHGDLDNTFRWERQWVGQSPYGESVQSLGGASLFPADGSLIVVRARIQIHDTDGSAITESWVNDTYIGLTTVRNWRPSGGSMENINRLTAGGMDGWGFGQNVPVGLTFVSSEIADHDFWMHDKLEDASDSTFRSAVAV